MKPLIEVSKITRDLAGTIIIDESLENIVIVKGRRSGKWGLPKGHIEHGEHALAAALRETYEETGLMIKLLVNVLPCILSKRAKLFLVKIPKGNTKFNIVDKGEIMEVTWYSIKNLEYLRDATRMLRDVCVRMDYIRGKVQMNNVNYDFSQTAENVEEGVYIFNKYLFHYLIKANGKCKDELIKSITKEFKGIFYEPELCMAIDKIKSLCEDDDMMDRFTSLIQIAENSSWKVVCPGRKNSMNFTLTKKALSALLA